jgi:hypothetical protein
MRSTAVSLTASTSLSALLRKAFSTSPFLRIVFIACSCCSLFSSSECFLLFPVPSPLTQYLSWFHTYILLKLSSRSRQRGP